MCMFIPTKCKNKDQGSNWAEGEDGASEESCLQWGTVSVEAEEEPQVWRLSPGICCYWEAENKNVELWVFWSNRCEVSIERTKFLNLGRADGCSSTRGHWRQRPKYKSLQSTWLKTWSFVSPSMFLFVQSYSCSYVHWLNLHLIYTSMKRSLTITENFHSL